MSAGALLDVNVLVGHHELAHDWFGDQRADGSLRDRRLFNPAFIRGHRQVSDVYLLGLAKRMSGRLATFDRGIPAGAVIGASRETLAVIDATG